MTFGMNAVEMWAERKRREKRNKSMKTFKNNKSSSANSEKDKTFSIEQLRSRMSFYDGYKMEPPPMPGTKLPELTLDYQLKFAKLQLEMYESFERSLGYGITGCFILTVIIGIGIIFGLPKLTIVVPFIIFLFIWVRVGNSLSNKRSWLFSTKLYIRKRLLRKKA